MAFFCVSPPRCPRPLPRHLPLAACSSRGGISSSCGASSRARLTCARPWLARPSFHARRARNGSGLGHASSPSSSSPSSSSSSSSASSSASSSSPSSSSSPLVGDDDEELDAVADDVTSRDRHHMRRALQLASMGDKQFTFPNPVVGCVLVNEKTQNVVGEGYHPKAGQPHAEVFALRAAGDQAKGATAYVTLEPCAHYGRTPPCALAFVEAGVRRVVVGCVDNNPLVENKGLAILREAGISVLLVGGEEEASCRAINEDFFERISQSSSS